MPASSMVQLRFSPRLRHSMVQLRFAASPRYTPTIVGLMAGWRGPRRARVGPARPGSSGSPTTSTPARSGGRGDEQRRLLLLLVTVPRQVRPPGRRAGPAADAARRPRRLSGSTYSPRARRWPGPPPTTSSSPATGRTTGALLLTASVGGSLSEGAESWIDVDGAPRAPWRMGRRLAFVVSVPEAQRARRHQLRTQLAVAGLGSPVPRVRACPDAVRLPEAHRALDAVGLNGPRSSSSGALRRPVRCRARCAGVGPARSRGPLRGLRGGFAASSPTPPTSSPSSPRRSGSSTRGGASRSSTCSCR